MPYQVPSIYANNEIEPRLNGYLAVCILEDLEAKRLALCGFSGIRVCVEARYEAIEGAEHDQSVLKVQAGFSQRYAIA